MENLKINGKEITASKVIKLLQEHMVSDSYLLNLSHKEFMNLSYAVIDLGYFNAIVMKREEQETTKELNKYYRKEVSF
tara:strand:+ start:29 stop:262 length:234 start_codon:yes stop_codon:yes gene_type:complete